jgi:F-type H+-transporting ATPase subunit gamma
VPSLKDIRRRIASIKKTRQITSAMKMVAAAKLRKATMATLNARPYQDQLGKVLGGIAARAGGSADHPLLAKREPERVLLVVFTSDRGLCGPFNTNLLRQVRRWCLARIELGVAVEIVVYGRKGRTFFEFQGIEFAEATVDYERMPRMGLVAPLAERMIEGFCPDRYDEVHLAYNTFVNNLTQRPTFEKVLPIQISAGETAIEGDYAYEPGAEVILGTLLPLYVRTRILRSFLETDAGQQAARMTATESATRNATELIDALTLQYNRARQAAITKEISEIVGGAEAL